MSVLKAFQESKKNRTLRNDLVNTLNQLAKTKAFELKEVEKAFREQKNKQESINNKRRSILEAFLANNLLKKKVITHPEIIYEAIDCNNSEIESCFEVFNLTKNKLDFVENMTLLYQKLVKEKLSKIVKKAFPSHPKVINIFINIFNMLW